MLYLENRILKHFNQRIRLKDIERICEVEIPEDSRSRNRVRKYKNICEVTLYRAYERTWLKGPEVLCSRSSYVGRRADALALRADERRDKLRKAAGSGKYTESRRYLNGATRQERLLSPCTESIGVRREPGELKHLSSRRKRKQP